MLATRLTGYAGQPDVLVLGLPRGGVPVAFEVAESIGAPLDVFLVRKLGVPGQEELAMGAIATGDVVVLNQEIVQALQIPKNVLDAVVARERAELERRERLYGATDHLRTCEVVRQCSWTTGSQPGRRCARPSRRFASNRLGESSSRCQWPRRKRAPSWGERSTRSFAPRRRTHFSPLATGTRTFRRSPMTRSEISLVELPDSLGGEPPSPRSDWCRRPSRDFCTVEVPELARALG